MKTLNFNVYGGVMHQTIEALNEALKWIRNEWMGGIGWWTGSLSEVCDACRHEAGLRVADIRMVSEAIKNGEHVDTGGFEVNANKIVVYKADNF